MDSTSVRGSVLVLALEHDAGERLGRWVEAAGERPVVVTGSEKLLLEALEAGDDETMDLLVTDLDSHDPSARALLDRCLGGALFEQIPQLHLFRDRALRDSLRRSHPAMAAVSLPSPPDPAEFESRVRLGAEVGRLRRELARCAIRDPLTGLANRRHLMARLDEEFSRARRYRTPLSLILFDIDHLKQINDAFGQSTGDVVIRGVAAILRARVRKEDVLGRVGEESFAVVMPGNRFRGAAVFANKVRTDCEEYLVRFDRGNAQVRLSAGISSAPDNGSLRCAEDLIRTTENALGQAKARGGNRIFIDEGVLRHERPVVLVADPDPALLDLAEDLLSLDDFHVVRADCARTALETLQLRRPDLLVLDLQMGADGDRAVLMEALEQLPLEARFPIIGLSRDASGCERGHRLGVDRFITKPFSLTVLRGLARELVGARAT